MTELKFFQVRDRGTHIPAMCVLVRADETVESRELRRAGFGKGTPYFLLTNLLTRETQYDPFAWDDRVTMYTAHQFIGEHWGSLESGSVVDAEFVRGERDAPKQPE